jgi:hypothetical protein
VNSTASPLFLRVCPIRMIFAIPFSAMLLFCTGGVAGQQGAVSSNGRPRVCTNVELVKAIRIIDGACTDLSCDFTKLKELDARVDKSTLLAALRDPFLQPVHIFFPRGKSDLDQAFDWRTKKEDQLKSIKFINDPANSIVYVIGRASTTGSRDTNITLSRERMRVVMNYIKYTLGVKCHAFHGGWLGREILQLNESDARLLNLEPDDFREDWLVLNQSVHVFVFPCADVL